MEHLVVLIGTIGWMESKEWMLIPSLIEPKDS